MELVYWHWIVLGIGLVIAEIVIPSFTALWFGIGAALVGVVLVVFPDMSLTLQVVLWAAFSGALTTIWYKVLKPSRDRISLPSLSEIEGELGVVLARPAGSRPGKVRFSTPIQKYDEWEFVSDDDIEIGDAVVVIGVNDNVLKMAKQR